MYPALEVLQSGLGTRQCRTFPVRLSTFVRSSTKPRRFTDICHGRRSMQWLTIRWNRRKLLPTATPGHSSLF